jgi:hypothetical protein
MLNPGFLARSNSFDDYIFDIFSYLGAFLLVVLQNFLKEIFLAHNKVFILVAYFLIVFLDRKICQVLEAILNIIQLVFGATYSQIKF